MNTTRSWTLYAQAVAAFAETPQLIHAIGTVSAARVTTTCVSYRLIFLGEQCAKYTTPMHTSWMFWPTRIVASQPVYKSLPAIFISAKMILALTLEMYFCATQAL